MEEETKKPEETPKEAPASGSKDVEENKAMAAIAYIWILFLIPMLTKKDSPFAMYHAKQGLALFVLSLISGFVFWIPFVGWAIGIFVFVLFIMGLINALQGQMKPLPLIGKVAEGLKI
ncbi:MAG: hypothetical protein NT135_00445 [Candidatus Berkelbacteria bacterium]|nr:hypothetical protein [Candidatus Berkelbacteria bacterium]